MYDYSDMTQLGAYYGVYDTRTFGTIFKSFDEFKEAYNAGYLPKTITEDSLKILYSMLYGRYGNHPIANYIDEGQFIIRLMSIIFQYGPTWEKRLEVQKKVREWDEETLLTGSVDIYNTALNPSVAPAASGLINEINQQNTSSRKKDRMSAYAMLLSLLEEDVSETFLSKFKPLFAKVLNPTGTYIYTTEENN